MSKIVNSNELKALNVVKWFLKINLISLNVYLFIVTKSGGSDEYTSEK